MNPILDDLNKKYVARTPHMRDIGMRITGVDRARGTMVLPARPDWLAIPPAACCIPVRSPSWPIRPAAWPSARRWTSACPMPRWTCAWTTCARAAPSRT